MHFRKNRKAARVISLLLAILMGLTLVGSLVMQIAAVLA